MKCKNCNHYIPDIVASYEDEFCSEDCYDEFTKCDCCGRDDSGYEHEPNCSNLINKEATKKYRLTALLCWIGLHNWEMKLMFMLWKCKWCGKEKIEHYE